MNKSWETKIAEQQAKDADEERKNQEIERAKESGKPQILNLNEDGILDRKIFVDLAANANARVGRKGPNPEQDPEVTLGGIGIQQEHAVFKTSGNQTKLVPSSDAAKEHIHINGLKMTSTSPYTLKPNDRIIFGTGTVFLYRC